MTNVSIQAILKALGAGSGRLDPRVLMRIEQLMTLWKTEPNAAIAETVKSDLEADSAKENCGKAAAAATELETILKKLLEGASSMFHLDTLRASLGGPLAVCRQGNQYREYAIHPDINIDVLRTLQPWEFVCIREQVVVGVWQDPSLFTAALGDVVVFRQYHDRDQGLVLVEPKDGPGQRVVRLAPQMRKKELQSGAQLVLQRDDERWAIALAESDASKTRSRFEVSIESVTTRLEDLAGMENLTHHLIQEVILHVLNPEIRNRYSLKPLHGFLLSSRKPGMGKTAVIRGLARFFYELGQETDFEVVLYVIPPNALKNKFHGEDARIVRDELWGAIRARAREHRQRCLAGIEKRALLQLVTFDELDSLGQRADANHFIGSGAQSDALEALLTEMDGMIQHTDLGSPPSYVLCAAATNLPERIDEALKRPGRFDLCVEMPDIDREMAEEILMIYARGDELPWYLDDQVQTSVDEESIRQRMLRPVLAGVMSANAAYYLTDSQRRVDVTAEQMLAGAHFEYAMNEAKKRAASRTLLGVGVPAITQADLAECLTEIVHRTAQQMAADPGMLVRQLQIKDAVTRVVAVPREEYSTQQFLRIA